MDAQVRGVIRRTPILGAPIQMVMVGWIHKMNSHLNHHNGLTLILMDSETIQLGIKLMNVQQSPGCLKERVLLPMVLVLVADFWMIPMMTVILYPI